MCSERILVCLKSASYWVDELPRYADRMQRRADWWAIAAGILSAITSLAIWPLFKNSNHTPELIVVSAVAFVAALCALVPRVKNYGEQAGQARELSGRYGSLKGQLMDIAYMSPMDQQKAQTVVADFQATKEKKDALRGLPVRPASGTDVPEVIAMTQEVRRAAAQAEAAAVKAEAAAVTAAKVAQAVPTPNGGGAGEDAKDTLTHVLPQAKTPGTPKKTE